MTYVIGTVNGGSEHTSTGFDTKQENKTSKPLLGSTLEEIVSMEEYFQKVPTSQ